MPGKVFMKGLLMLEVLDGFQAAERIKEQFPRSDRRPTIIAVTASESIEESMRCLQLGMGANSMRI